ncbi:hypothetical protein CHLRE_08g369976v5 [Chlamydomonas reinhardtii]|uniref:Uncharacterized protein n=1 Tax=Chlamydomonas reinhardtii TaxID=3055 RepID=A0A2K3DH44_CHLRE|nr:uncharacterized protein CHLRE_08g369976v5 [Chlamydomonas reinhardtii]PNW79870.1 hypothetical protein CHLRE_08g369976v5 [Chlamydomonas reinhardtii]
MTRPGSCGSWARGVQFAGRPSGKLAAERVVEPLRVRAMHDGSRRWSREGTPGFHSFATGPRSCRYRCAGWPCFWGRFG